jgi:hypothetical protein
MKRIQNQSDFTELSIHYQFGVGARAINSKIYSQKPQNSLVEIIHNFYLIILQY